MNSTISMFYIFIVTVSIITFLNIKYGNNVEKCRSFFPIIYKLLLFISYIEIILMFFLRNNLIYLSQLEFIYECICWNVILVSLIFVKEIKFKPFYKNKLLNGIEKNLFLGSLVFGMVCLVFMFSCNKGYVYPIDKFGVIDNFYFNADVYRGIDSATSIVLPHTIHPGYRFILLPIVIPMALVVKLLAMLFMQVGIYSNIILGYFICIVQILLNSLSSILFYRILRNLHINSINTIFGTIVFIVSFSSVWVSIFPETYAITLTCLLCSIYLYQKKNYYYIVMSIITVTLNPIVIIPLIPIIFREIYVFKGTIILTFKKYTILISTLFMFILVLTCIISFKIFIPYIQKWTNLNHNIISSIKSSISYEVMTWFIGPNYKNIVPYFVQSFNTTVVQKIEIIFFLFICLIGIIENKMKVIIVSSTITLVCAFFLHVVLGYGRYNGIIYSSLYTWAAILLLTLGIDFLFLKIGKRMNAVFIIIIILISIQNLKWVYSMGGDLKNMHFSSEIEELPIQFNLINKDHYEKFIVENNNIYRYLDQKIILKNIHCYHINYEDRSISGLLDDSSWFKVYESDDGIYSDVNGRIIKIDSNQDLNKQFYIFGMGLRDKYMFRKKGDSKYELFRYGDSKKILENITCNNIDAENYSVTGLLSDGKPFKIFENCNGIFLEKAGTVLTLDDSVKINIPSFKDRRYSKQLKILFNEVMVNVTKKGPTPNFLAYPNPWYRDAAIMSMVLEKTNNTSQIDEWLNNIKDIYDMQNGNKEPDNLGELLYLISLTKNKNEQLIKNIINEAEILRGTKSYIEGKTDGALHPVYQTRWIIYGLKRLGLDYSKYILPKKYDSYESLMWFDGIGQPKLVSNEPDISDRFQYLYFAKLHFYNKKVDIIDKEYPISYELSPSKADFKNLKVINDNFYNNELVTPHGWSAAEMFLYLLDE